LNNSQQFTYGVSAQPATIESNGSDGDEVGEVVVLVERR